MIAVDTSSFIAYLQGESGKDTDLLENALRTKQAVIPPVVLTELLSDPKLASEIKELFRTLPVLEITEGYWERGGNTRAALHRKGHKARLADALIAQSCLDHRVGLLTRDSDFKPYVQIHNLVLVQ